MEGRTLGSGPAATFHKYRGAGLFPNVDLVMADSGTTAFPLTPTSQVRLGTIDYASTTTASGEVHELAYERYNGTADFLSVDSAFSSEVRFTYAATNETMDSHDCAANGGTCNVTDVCIGMHSLSNTSVCAADSSKDWHAWGVTDANEVPAFVDADETLSPPTERPGVTSNINRFADGKCLVRSQTHAQYASAGNKVHGTTADHAVNVSSYSARCNHNSSGLLHFMDSQDYKENAYWTTAGASDWTAGGADMGSSEDLMWKHFLKFNKGRGNAGGYGNSVVCCPLSTIQSL